MARRAAIAGVVGILLRRGRHSVLVGINDRTNEQRIDCPLDSAGNRYHLSIDFFQNLAGRLPISPWLATCFDASWLCNSSHELLHLLQRRNLRAITVPDVSTIAPVSAVLFWSSWYFLCQIQCHANWVSSTKFQPTTCCFVYSDYNLFLIHEIKWLFGLQKHADNNQENSA